MMAKFPAKRGGAVGAFGDRHAEEERVGEEAAEADGDGIGGRAGEQQACAEEPGGEAGERPDVEAGHQAEGIVLRKIERGDGAEQKAGRGEGLGEGHHTLDGAFAEDARTGGGVAEGDQQEDRQDDVDQDLHVCVSPPSR